MLYLDDKFPEHPKIARAGGDAAWLWIAAACWVKRHKTGGRIPKAVVPQLTDRRAPLKLAGRLVAVELWVDDGDEFVFHEWADHNWSEKRAKTAAEARWGKANPDAQASSSTGASIMLDGDSAHAPAGGRARAPRPRPLASNSPSSTHDGGGAPPDDDDRMPVGNRAIGILAERALERRQADDVVARKGRVESEPGWLAKDAAKRMAQHAERIAELVGEHPAITAEQLADLLEPPLSPPSLCGPEDSSVVARRERDELLAARERTPCPDCDAGFQWTETGVVPCESCGRSGVAAGAGR